MLKAYRKFRLLSREKKDMIMLFWIYELVGTTAGIFMGSFVFLKTGSLLILTIYILIQIIATGLAFSGYGYLMARFGYSMKWNYLRSFFVYFISFVFLALTPHTTVFFLIFSFLNGLGLGLFWLGNHSYEMLYTKNENGDRDFYSSMLQGGTQVINILAPLIGTLVIFLSEKVFDIGTFSILFWVLPMLYLVSLPFLFSLPHFIPNKITKLDIKSFFKNKVSKKIKLYYILQGEEEIRVVAISFFAIIALKTFINIGILQTLVAVISFFITVLLANIRCEGNRLKLMSFAIVGFSIATIFLGFSNISVYFYITYSLLMILFKPMYKISQHTIDLRSMDFLAKDRSSFYPGILYREVFLSIGRFLFLLFLILISLLIKNDIVSARVGLLIAILIFVTNWFIARKMLKES
jgi:MFS family permease